MPNPFAGERVAAGYARSRPPVHGRVLELVAAQIGAPPKFARALDVGCGAGLSTAPLSLLAKKCIGVEPAEHMLAWGAETAPHAHFVAGAGEALPFRTASMDLITAAGSLNYVELAPFFAEAKRVLVPHGRLVVYDFSPGKSFPDSDSLDEWFAAFIERFPWPPGEARQIDPAILAQLDCGFSVEHSGRFEIPVELSLDFYLDYMMTETNVAFAIRNGAPARGIRAWCAGTLRPVFGEGRRQVLFKGYFACLSPL
jgi:SAM-dependent methyltransferase